jgi:hypothetical protein
MDDNSKLILFQLLLQAMSPTSTLSLETPESSKPIPRTESANVSNGTDLHRLVCKYKLGDAALADTDYKAKLLFRKVKVVINKFAVDPDGRVSKRWARQPIEVRYRMLKELTKNVCWLSRFEENWAAEWLLSKGVNQRKVDAGRKTANQKALTDEVIYSDGDDDGMITLEVVYTL